MPTRMVRPVLVVVCLVSMHDGLRAQVITGRLVGTVRDATGAVLPGATVTLSSPDLIGGPKTQTTSASGQYRFPNLAPGVYALMVSHEGFSDYSEEDLRISVGATVERNAVLRLAGVEEAILVRGESPLIDTHEAGLSSRIESSSLQNLPVARNSIYDLMGTVPGVSSRSYTDENPYLSVFGSGTNENTFLLDGANLTTTSMGNPWPEPDTDIMEEIEIVSLGASAEYGNLTGAVFNVVTKQGGNDFRFDASYYFQSQSLTSRPVELECNCPSDTSGYHREHYRDFSTHLGGPILRDRLWFFGGYQRQRSADSQPGADPDYPREVENDRMFWKITWQVTPNLHVLHSFHTDFWAHPGTPSVSRPYETTATQDGHSPASTFADVTHYVSANTFWEARISSFRGPAELTPNGDPTAAPHFDIATGMSSGGAQFFGWGDETRTTVQAKVSHYTDDFLSSGHDFKFGAQYVRGSFSMFYGYPGGGMYYDYAGEPYLAYLRQPYGTGGRTENLGVFAEDVVRIGQRLTLNLGLRFDHTRAISPDLPEVNALGEETGGTVSGLGTLYTWNDFSPRVGVNVQLTDDGRTALRAAYGRFHQGVMGMEMSVVHPGVSPISLAFYDPATEDFAVVATFDPLADIEIDPRTRSPNVDQISVGVDRELGRDYALGISYVYKDGRDFIGWTDTGGIYGEDTATLEDGSQLTVYPLLNDASERFFVLTNVPEFFLRYNGLLLTLTKRWSHDWQAAASYSLSEARGLMASSWFFAGAAQPSSTFGWNTYGRDPNHFTNSTGNLPNDRTHMFRAQGSWQIPRIGVLVAANFQYLTGKPWTGWAVVRLPQGALPLKVEPRGSRRVSSQSLLDLRLSKSFHLGSRGRVDLLVDILNLLNDSAEEGHISENVFSPQFGEPSQFVLPRRAMIGLKLVF